MVKFRKISLAKLKPRKTTLRIPYSGDEFVKLVASMGADGLTNPITVKGTTIIDGEARVQAARQLGWKTIMARCL